MVESLEEVGVDLGSAGLAFGAGVFVPLDPAAGGGFDVGGWVQWYNNQRLHSSLGYVAPAEYEATHYATITTESRPA